MDGKAIRNKLIGSDDQRAVSPVIGVILMVAITVILAAVIAAFVLDMGSGLEDSAQAGVNIEGDDTTSVTVTTEALSNADGVVVINGDGDAQGDAMTSVGESQSYYSSGSGDVSVSGGSDYQVVAYFGSASDRSGTTIVGEFTVSS